MAIKTQKTKLYAIDALGTSVLGICATSISVGSASSDEIDITTLCDDTKQYLAGLQESPEVTFTINFDPKIAAHVELLAMKKAGTVTKFALGLSDGVADPTAAAGDFTLPTTRSKSVSLMRLTPAICAARKSLMAKSCSSRKPSESVPRWAR